MNYALSTFGPGKDQEAVDFEIRNGFIHILNVNHPTGSNLAFEVRTVDGAGALISSSIVPGGFTHDVIALDLSGVILNHGGVQVTSSIAGASSISATVEAHTIETLNDSTVFIGGRNTNFLADAFVGRFTYRTATAEYEPALSTLTNNATSIGVATSSLNTVLDLELNPAGNWLFATGFYDVANPMNSTLTASGPSDAFMIVLNPFGLNLFPPGFTSPGTSGASTGNAIDVANINQTGTVYDIAVAGDADGDLTNWGATVNPINNAFVTRFTYDASTSSVVPQWTNVLDYSSTIQSGSGTGVVFSELYVHASGVFDGSNFDLFGGGCTQPGSAGNNSGFLVTMDRPAGFCVSSGSTQSFNPGHTAVDIGYDANRLFVAGDYEDAVTMHSAAIPPTVAHPNAGLEENYVVRYDVAGANYFKTNEATSTNELVEEELSITLAPNPSKGKVMLLGSIVENTRFTVTDLTGKVVFETVLNSTTNELSLEHLPKGAYLTTLSSSSDVVHQTLVLE